MTNVIRRGFIFPENFKRTTIDTIDLSLSHEELAKKFIMANPELLKKYSIFNGSYCDFLVLKVGCIKVGNKLGSNKVICYSSDLLSKELWYYVEAYQSL